MRGQEWEKGKLFSHREEEGRGRAERKGSKWEGVSQNCEEGKEEE